MQAHLLGKILKETWHDPKLILTVLDKIVLSSTQDTCAEAILREESGHLCGVCDGHIEYGGSRCGMCTLACHSQCMCGASEVKDTCLSCTAN